MVLFNKDPRKDEDRLPQWSSAEYNVRPETSFLSPYEILSCMFQQQGETFQIFSRRLDFLVWWYFGHYLRFFASGNLFLQHCIVICSPAESLFAQAPRQVVCEYFSNFSCTKLEFSFQGFLSSRYFSSLSRFLFIFSDRCSNYFLFWKGATTRLNTLGRAFFLPVFGLIAAAKQFLIVD